MSVALGSGISTPAGAFLAALVILVPRFRRRCQCPSGPAGSSQGAPGVDFLAERCKEDGRLNPAVLCGYRSRSEIASPGLLWNAGGTLGRWLEMFENCCRVSSDVSSVPLNKAPPHNWQDSSV